MDVSGRKGSKEGTSSKDMFCLPCDRDGERQTATGYCQDCQEHLCDICYRSHKRSKASKDHVLLDARKMPKPPVPTPRKRNDCNVPCPKHNDKIIDFFCRDHNDVVCYVCSTLDHSSCKKDYIPDISGAYVKGPDCFSKLKRMESLLKTCNDMHQRATDSIQEVGRAYSETNDSIDQFRKEINEVLDQWQSEIKEEADEIKRTSVEILTSISETLSSLKTKITGFQSRIDQLNKSGNTDRLFVELMQAQTQIDKYETTIKQQQTTSRVSKCAFTANVHLRNLLQEQNCIGTLNMSSEYLKQSKDIKTKFEKEIYVKTSEDESICYITGMAMLSENTLVISDYNNSSIKLVDTNTNKLISSQHMSPPPWDVAPLPGTNQIAIALATKGIRIMSTKPSLSIVRTLTVDGISKGIAYGLGKLVVTYVNPGKYQILSLQGEVLFTSSPDLGLCKFPFDVAVSKDEQYILVSDSGNDRVIMIDWEGNMLGQYKDTDLKDANGVVSCNDGSFLICSKGTHTVHRVSADCIKMTVIEEEDMIEYPRVLCYKADDSIYVMCTSERFANFIKVVSM